MAGDRTSAGAARTPADLADDADLDDTVAAAIAGDTVPADVVQAARDAGTVPADAALEEAIAALTARDFVPDAVIQDARRALRTGRGAKVAEPGEPDADRSRS